MKKWQLRKPRKYLRSGITALKNSPDEITLSIIAEINKDRTEPIFIDEVGPLEIVEQKGFYELLKRVLKLKQEVYISIRNELIDESIKDLKINEPRITPITRIGIKKLY